MSSSPSVANACAPPASSSRTRSPLKPQPACSGVITSSKSGTDGLLHQLLDLAGLRHRVGAGQPRGHERARGVAEAHHALEVPAGEQTVAQRATEGVAGAEAVDHLDRHRRDLDRRLPAVGAPAARAPLPDRDPPAAPPPRPPRRARPPPAPAAAAPPLPAPPPPP